MSSQFKVFITAHIAPGYTPEQAKLVPGALTQVLEKEVLASLESDAIDLALDSVINEISTAESDPEACTFTCHAVRLSPVRPVEPDIAEALRRKYASVPLRIEPSTPGESACWLCQGFGFVADFHQDWLLCRCAECNRFPSEKEMFEFIYFKLTGLASREVGSAIPSPSQPGESPQAGC